MDKYIESRKILILEGTQRVVINDSSHFFSNYDKAYHDLRGMSPLEQTLEIAGSPEWTESFIRECFMRDIWFLQAWDLSETIELLNRMDEGFDQESKLRLIPKKIPEFGIQQLILAQVSGIGKVKSAKILEQVGTIENLIKALKKKELEIDSKTLRRLHDAFIKKPEKIIK